RLENGDNSSENDINILDLVIKSLENDTSASDITDAALSSDVYQGEDKKIIYKEWISNEIRERNQEKKLRSQEVSGEETKLQGYDSSNQKIPYNQKVEQGLVVKFLEILIISLNIGPLSEDKQSMIWLEGIESNK
ncbi:3271_t:CDS:2, partial [Racocetra fulgida]